MASHSKALLDFEDDALSTLKEGLLLKNPSVMEEQMLTKIVKPEPGFCVKTKDDQGQKVFINVCSSKELPPPKDISETELISLLESEDPGLYKIPMSLGNPHPVQDKGGKPSTAFDVVINTEFYDKVQSSLMFKTFMITVSMDGLEDKHKINLDRNDWTVLKNKKYFGEMAEVTIKQKGAPLITELSHVQKPERKFTEANTVATKTKLQVPKFTLYKGFSETHEKSLFAEIHLPNVKTASCITLDIGEDRIVLAASDKYKLDIFLPVDINPDSTVATYHKHNQVLNLTISILDN